MHKYCQQNDIPLIVRSRTQATEFKTIYLSTRTNSSLGEEGPDHETDHRNLEFTIPIILEVHDMPRYATESISELSHFSSLSQNTFYGILCSNDRLCGLEVTVSGYRSRGPGSIPGATRFSEKRGYLEEKVAAPVYKVENTAVGIRHADHVAPSIRKSWH
jgi:hypothetical protein